MRSIYKEGGGSLQLAGTYPIWKCISLYGAIGYQERSGRSHFAHESTRIWQIPIDVGVKPIFNITDTVQYYFAVGPRYFHLKQHNNSSDVQRNVVRNGVGFFVNTGFNFFPWRRVTADVFGEYSYERLSPNSSKTVRFGKGIQVGGLLFGMGLGYRF